MMKNKRNKSNHCNLNPVLYNCYLQLRDTLGAEIVHRRSRKSTMCIEVVFNAPLIQSVSGRMNTLKAAEKCGFWVICRRQRTWRRCIWHNKAVFQLYLSPVHPKKRHEARVLAQTAEQVSFEPIIQTRNRRRRKQTLGNLSGKNFEKFSQNLHICKKCSTFVRFLTDEHEYY